MWQYIVKRLLLMIPTLIGAALVIFLLMNIIPGDVALLIIGGDQGGDINPRELAKLRTQLGLGSPAVRAVFLLALECQCAWTLANPCGPVPPSWKKL